MLFRLSAFAAFAAFVTLGLTAAAAQDDFEDACEVEYSSSARPLASTTYLQTTPLVQSPISTSTATTLLTSLAGSKTALAVERTSPVTLVASIAKTATAVSVAPTSAATGSSGLTSASVNGDGTWYGEDCGEESCWQGGACAFVDYVLPTSIAGSTCMSELIWNSSYNCGGCVEITYKGTKKIAMVSLPAVDSRLLLSCLPLFLVPLLI